MLLQMQYLISVSSISESYNNRDYVCVGQKARVCRLFWEWVQTPNHLPDDLSPVRSACQACVCHYLKRELLTASRPSAQ